MSGDQPRASFSQGPETWRPRNAADNALGREFAHGIASGHAEDRSIEFGAVLTFLGGYIAGAVSNIARSL